MPSGRLSKRPGELTEPPQDGLPGTSKVKLPRLEKGPEDFSQLVRGKLQSHTRTGQACDRCKVRYRSVGLSMLVLHTEFEALAIFYLACVLCS
jgi:hypothetical protein